MAVTMDHPRAAFIFGILGNVISLAAFLTPVVTFKRIWKRKSTEGFQSLPYVVALFSCILWLYYATLKTNVFLLVTINSVGCAIEIIYILIYIKYADKRARNFCIAQSVVMNVACLPTIILPTYFMLHGLVRVKVVGVICVVISTCVFVAPLSILVKVIRTKSVEFMPIHLSTILTVSAIMWFCYGIFVKDIWITIPNVVGFTLGLIQMVVYFIYRGRGERPLGTN
ncbi:hypothetical protein HN51_014100 [Arachis hypogaea]|uniref:bidirectional sugar transporter N3-like n=1 Tax=Arachis ipaensis TaxID=130454 RepID=UPI0007AFCD89|nr:bidirectional sugar transporter N3-like [Arachis ipaensis]XP_025639626.1 bidirectional sugar transporter N3-like [Arachis hypogaea]QHO59976.1 Bidirectional sugar transporter [Arachis hypogaea]